MSAAAPCVRTQNSRFYCEKRRVFKDRYINIEEKEFEDNLSYFLFDVFEGYINHRVMVVKKWLRK
jgi:hypothetical protein